jgi:hypothetical protein
LSGVQWALVSLDLHAKGNKNPLVHLAKAIAKLKDAAGSSEIGFVVPGDRN